MTLSDEQPPAPKPTPEKTKSIQGDRVFPRIMAKRARTEFFRHMSERKIDWFFLGALIVFFVSLEYIANPFERYIPREELGDLQFPFKEKNTVPTWTVPIIGVGIPLVIILVAFSVPAMFGKIEQREFHDLVYAILINVAITGTMTSALKDSIGRPRPNFLHRCYPNKSDDELYDLVSQENFTVECSKAKSGTLEEGRKSFPSGHSSWAMCSLAFMTFFMLGKLRPFDGRGEVWRLVVSIIPVCIAVGIGITRINDYWHHWTDVVAGFALGLVVSIAVYTMYYPWPVGRNGTDRPLYKDKEPESLGTETGTASSENSRLPLCDPMQGDSSIEIQGLLSAP
ncbi:hypothetical protein BSKO_01469 [Bryopsis sp. KO-2023]|nr:hypothetical protein BSKO_01469 [Bryopsis sp. KO-2023]